MTLKPEYLLDISKDLRDDIDMFCKLRRCTFDQIWNADKSSVWDMAKVNGLIVYLDKKWHPLHDIQKVTRQGRQYIIDVIGRSKVPDFPIRTTNYERLT